MKSTVRLLLGSLGTITLLLLATMACNMLIIKLHTPSLALEDKFIAHAGGILDGTTYTNTIEATQQSIDFGYKAIEIDFLVTSDNQLIAGHDWRKFNNNTGFTEKQDSTTTFQEAKSRHYLGYNVAGADDIAQLFEQNPHVTLVTDKVDDYQLLDRYFSHIKGQILVEAFSMSRYKELKKHGYTPMLNPRALRGRGIHKLLFRDIDWIVMKHDLMPHYKMWFLNKVLGIKLALFTINDIERCHVINNYANLIYTDSLRHPNL